MRDDKGKVSLWKNQQWERGSNKPYVRGKVIAHRDIRAGEEVELALWVSTSENERAPALTGKLSDPRPREQQRSAPPAQDDDFSDSIPF